MVIVQKLFNLGGPIMTCVDCTNDGIILNCALSMDFFFKIQYGQHYF